jgi:hypothetical protein
MNEIENRRYKETLDKEKKLRREWNHHDAMQQVFDAGSQEMSNLNNLCDHLENACADQTRTTTGETERPSRRKQLVSAPRVQPRCRPVQPRGLCTLIRCSRRAHLTGLAAKRSAKVHGRRGGGD